MYLFIDILDSILQKTHILIIDMDIIRFLLLLLWYIILTTFIILLCFILILFIKFIIYI